MDKMGAHNITDIVVPEHQVYVRQLLPEGDVSVCDLEDVVYLQSSGPEVALRPVHTHLMRRNHRGARGCM